MFDIGGGSTEYMLARAGAAVAAVSLRLGVVDLAERYPFPARVDWPRYQALQAEVAGRLARELPPAILAARPARIVGTAGTVTALAALDLGLTTYDRAARPGPHAAAHGRRASAAASRRPDRRRARRLPCLEPGRADLIVPGVAVVLATLVTFTAGSLVVSDAALREGVVLQLSTGQGVANLASLLTNPARRRRGRRFDRVGAGVYARSSRWMRLRYSC